MSYISAIAIDFGSTNSGAARIDHFTDGKLTFTTPTLLYADGYYAKDATWFYVHPEMLNSLLNTWDTLDDSDFKILSRVSNQTEHPNIIWGKHFIKENADMISTEHWVSFKYFKMMIYKNIPYKTEQRDYPIEFVVKLFLRILKIDCLNVEKARCKSNITSEQIQWGVTIPSIWSLDNKRLMTRLCEDIFGKHVRILSEPEGPIVAERLHSGVGFVGQCGQISLVIDVGGGTTDICLVEDVNCIEIKFNLLASSAGIGIGGNNIDNEFEIYFLKFISSNLVSESGIKYDDLNMSDLKELLLTPYLSDLKNAISFEEAWLNFKHGNTSNFIIPNNYRFWLNETGHKSVAKRIGEILLGDLEFGGDELFQQVFIPIYEKISNNIENFLRKNIVLIEKNRNNTSLVFAGGLSLAYNFRDFIHSRIITLLNYDLKSNLAFGANRTSGSIMALGSIMASGSIMEGASYILLNRRSIKRRAKTNIFDMFTDIRFDKIKHSYAEKGVTMSLGLINEIANKDIEERGAYSGLVAMPVAIKGEYFTDYSAPFFAKNENQSEIKSVFYSSNEIIIYPFNNTKAKELCEFSVPNESKEGFLCTVDFNESEIGSNMHCYVTRSDTDELVFEENYLISEE